MMMNECNLSRNKNQYRKAAALAQYEMQPDMLGDNNFRPDAPL